MKLWPFTNKKAAEQAEIVDDLQKRLEEIQEDYTVKTLDVKNYDQEAQVNGWGVVDEFYDKGQLQRLFCTEGWLYIAVNTIAKQLASLPMIVEKRYLEIEERERPDGSVIKLPKAVWIKSEMEPEQFLINNPNQAQPSMLFWMLVYIDLLSTGESFIFLNKQDMKNETETQRRINREQKTNIQEMIRLNSSAVRVAKSESGEMVGYEYVTEEAAFRFGQDEIIHLRLPNPCDQWSGLAPILPVLKNLLLDRYSQEHLIRFYKQGARLGGVIKTSKNLNREQISRLERSFESNYTGKRNHHRTLILPQGMDYDTVEANPAESSLLEFMRTNKEPILSTYGLPPVKIGLLDGAAFANAKIQDKTFYQDTVRPLTKMIVETLNNSSALGLKERGVRIRYDFSGIDCLQKDTTERGDVAKKMAASGFTINEIRERAWELPPVDGGELSPLIEKTKREMAGVPTQSTPTPEKSYKDVANAQNDSDAIAASITDTKATFEERVAELVAHAVNEGVSVNIATQRAVAQALDEGLNPTIIERPVEEEPKQYGFSKGQLNDYAAKVAGEGADPIIKKFEEEFKGLHKRAGKFFLKKMMKDIKKDKSLLKSKNAFYHLDLMRTKSDDADEFIEGEELIIPLLAVQHGYTTSELATAIGFDAAIDEVGFTQYYKQAVKDAFGTVFKRFSKAAISSVASGDTTSETIKKIAELADEMAETKSGVLSRTEILKAVSKGQELKRQEFLKEFPKMEGKLRKMWVTAKDEKVRGTHKPLEGKTVKHNETFPNGLKYPREEFGHASEVVNCRCTTIDVLPEDEDLMRDNLNN